jgi:xanthosine phosphorylase
MNKITPIIDTISKRAPSIKPKIGIILGSGLGSIAEKIQDSISISYSDLPGFPVSTVAGHAGKMILGYLNQMPVVCMQGRVHPYEGADNEAFKIFIRTLKLLGCEILLITNSSGSLHQDIGPGQLVLINDHINFHRGNPLIGKNEDEFGERFFAMDDAYDKNLRDRFHKVAKEQNIKLNEGVYFGTPGPCFETPAEIRAFRILGGDLVGMSTVPEVLVARHCGLRVAAVSAITNFAAGMSDEVISHEGTLHYGKIAASNLSELILSFIQSFKNEPC